MQANKVFNISININNEPTIFIGRILYWWEEQNIKIDSVYEDKRSGKLIQDHSKIYINTINKFLISVEASQKILNKDNLYELSVQKNKTIEWSDVLHHAVVMPLYEAYINISGSSIKEMQEFRKKVIAAYDKKMRVGEFEDFPLPPELIEYDFLYTNGVITRSDLLQMSYAEVLKYQAIREIDARYKNKQQIVQQPQPTQFPTEPIDLQSLAAQSAKQHFPDVTRV